MTAHADQMLPGRILVVDDEQQIHSAIKLRLGKEYELEFCLSGQEALERIAKQRFDLCFADINMPQMDGLTFVDAARKVDGGLGYVIVSAFDTDENLRRVIPLQVLEFISKPLPEPSRFDSRIPEWIRTTRARRRESALASEAATIANDLEAARLERDVEMIASESTREALAKLSGTLTTVHAHFVAVDAMLSGKTRADLIASHLRRSVEEGRKSAEGAMAVASEFLEGAYGDRVSSPALFDACMEHAIGLARKWTQADEAGKVVEFFAPEFPLYIRGVSGIEFLLMLVPALSVAMAFAPEKSTLRIEFEMCKRLEAVTRDMRFANFLWLNRRNALTSRNGIVISVVSSGCAPLASHIESWIGGRQSPVEALSSRGLLVGVQKCHGLLGFATSPWNERFRLILALPA